MIEPVIRQVIQPVLSPIDAVTGGGGLWTPANLFQSSEQGAYYDFSDFSTLFQDSAGTTPVTEVGQPVGFMLDKSQGLVRGAELVTNGDFSAGSAGWYFEVTGANDITVASGSVRFQSLGADNARIYQQSILAIGSTYEITFDVLAGSSGKLKVLPVGPTGEAVFSCTPGTKSFVSVASNATLVVSRVVGKAVDAYITNISVREVPGNHATQSTASKRPLLQQHVNGAYYADFDGVDDALEAYFATAPGSNCTVAYAIPGSGASITTGVTIGAGTYSFNTDCSALVVVNRALSSGETASLTAWLNARAGL